MKRPTTKKEHPQKQSHRTRKRERERERFQDDESEAAARLVSGRSALAPLLSFFFISFFFLNNLFDFASASGFSRVVSVVVVVLDF